MLLSAFWACVPCLCERPGTVQDGALPLDAVGVEWMLCGVGRVREKREVPDVVIAAIAVDVVNLETLGNGAMMKLPHVSMKP